MSASKADKCRFWIAIFLNDLRPETVFHPGLLHLTLIPWFVSDTPDKIVVEAFTSKFAHYKKFSLKLGERTTFGPNQDISVNLVEPSGNLSVLHQISLDYFSSIGGRWAVKNPYVGSEFKPHIRRRRGTKLKAGQIIRVDRIDLVKARREEDHLRQLAAKVELL